MRRLLPGAPQGRILFTAGLSLLVNLISALGHGALGLWTNSAWYMILGAYYAMLAVMRYGLVRTGRGEQADERIIQRFCGGMLLALSVVLAQTVVMGYYFDKAVRHHPIIMITLAAWTCGKVTMAVVNIVRIRRNPSPVLRTIRSIACAAAAASVVTLQRSMIATFGGMPEERLMNALTGGAACLYILLLGLVLRSNENTLFAHHFSPPALLRSGQRSAATPPSTQLSQDVKSGTLG